MTQKKTDKKTETIPVFTGRLEGQVVFKGMHTPNFAIDADDGLPKINDTITIKTTDTKITGVVKSVNKSNIILQTTSQERI